MNALSSSCGYRDPLQKPVARATMTSPTKTTLLLLKTMLKAVKVYNFLFGSGLVSSPGDGLARNEWADVAPLHAELGEASPEPPIYADSLAASMTP